MDIGILLTKRGGILGPIANLFGFLMNGIYEALSFIGIENLGLCIILYTTIIYMLMLPMQIKQQKFSRISSVMTPEIQAIQKKYKDKKDQASMIKMQEETKLVYQKYGTTPVGGCFGSLIQIPFLFALWPVIQNIPAYVTNLKQAYNKFGLVEEILRAPGYQGKLEKFASANRIFINAKSYEGTNAIVDILYNLRGATWDKLAEVFPDLGDAIAKTEEYVRRFNYFPTAKFGINIAETPSSMFSAAISNFSIVAIIVALAIPVIAAFTQWLSIKISQDIMDVGSRSNDDNAMAKQTKMMMKVMPLTSLLFGFSMPVGLGIYWIASAVVRTLQQIFINRILKKKTIDELVQENVEKAAKKRNKKKSVDSKNMNSMAKMYTKRLDEMKAQIIAEADAKEKTEAKKEVKNQETSHQSNAKPGSLASKANMVRDYNNRNNK